MSLPRLSLSISCALALPLLTLLTPGSAQAGGFYVPEVGARSMSMANAVTAQSEDVSMLFHNPAGLAGQEGTQIQLNGLAVMPSVDFFRAPVEDPNDPSRTIRFDKVSNTNKFAVVPSLFVASDFGVENLSVGLGVYLPYAAHIVYPDDGDQRYVVQEAEVRTFFVSPTVAYKFWDRLSVGVGLNYVFSDFHLRQANTIPFVIGPPESNPDPDPQLDGSNDVKGKDPAKFGANIGVTYTDPEDRFAVGMSVMTPIRPVFKGNAKLENEGILPFVDADGNEVLPAGVRNDKFSLEFPMPLIVRAGMMMRPHDQVMVSFDVNWQRWETMDELVLDLENNYPLQPTPGAVAYDVVIPQKWKNTWSVRAGLEGQPKDTLPLFLRAGVLFDQSPISDRYFDVLTPESDKFGLSGGLGYHLNIRDKVRMDFDLAYMYLGFKERNIAPVKIGPDTNSGNDDNDDPLDDSRPNGSQTTIPGSDKTILNKPAPSFYHGVTRAAFHLVGLSIGVRI